MIQLALADHHSSRMLSKMTRQILYPHAKLEKLVDVGMLHIKAGMQKRMFQRVVLSFPFPLRNQAG
jgi:hypothetical protein